VVTTSNSGSGAHTSPFQYSHRTTGSVARVCSPTEDGGPILSVGGGATSMNAVTRAPGLAVSSGLAKWNAAPAGGCGPNGWNVADGSTVIPFPTATSGRSPARARSRS
jgi:hypothetical protein